MVLHHHFHKFFKVDGTVSVGVGLAEHLVALSGAEHLSVARHGVSQLLLGDGAVVVVVKRPEKKVLTYSLFSVDKR